MSKATRKDLLNAPDEFITTTGSAVKWIKENPVRFAVMIAVVAVVFAGSAGFYYWKTGRENTAMLEYGNAWNSSQKTLEVMQTYADTRAGDLSRLRLARMALQENNPKMAIDHAQEFVNEWGRKDGFHWQGILILAAAHLSQQEFDKVIPLLEDGIKHATENIRDQALFYKAQALIGLGKKDEARKTLALISESYHDIAEPSLATLSTHQGDTLNAEQ